MTREEKAIKALKWFKAYNEEDYCGGDRIQDEHGDWYYRITEQDFEAFDTAIKALEQEPTTKIDCDKTDCNNCVNHKCCDYEPTTKNDLGVDCISRKAALDITWHDPSYSDPLNVLTEVRDKIRELPSVTPQPRKGHWDIKDKMWWVCSACGCQTRMMKKYNVPNFCPACGAKMAESEE